MIDVLLAALVIVLVCGLVGLWNRDEKIVSANAAADGARLATSIAAGQLDLATSRMHALDAALDAERGARAADALLHDAIEGKLAAELAQARKDRDALAARSPAAAGALLAGVLAQSQPTAPGPASGEHLPVGASAVPGRQAG